MNDKKTICFDLDGVLCSQTDGQYENALPNDEAIELVNRLHGQGYRIIIYTARFMGRNRQNLIEAYKQGYELTLRQLKQWGVRFNELFLGKPAFDLLIDDRAVFYRNDLREIENVVINAHPLDVVALDMPPNSEVNHESGISNSDDATKRARNCSTIKRS